MSERVTEIRTTAQDSARAVIPAGAALAGVAALAATAIIVVRHRRHAATRRLIGNLKTLAETIQDPAVPVEALGKLPAKALSEVIERQPPPPLGARLLEVAVKTAVTTAVGFGLKALRERMSPPAAAPTPKPAPGKRSRH